MSRSDKSVIVASAKAVREIDRIATTEISGMDQFYLDTARELLMKVVSTNGYMLSEKGYRVVKKK